MAYKKPRIHGELNMQPGFQIPILHVGIPILSSPKAQSGGNGGKESITPSPCNITFAAHGVMSDMPIN